MPKRVIESADMPAALGPYSQAVGALGELVFISGQAGLAADGSVSGEFAAQARQAFENIKNVVEASGLSMTDVAKTTIYLADASQFPVLNDLFGEYFPKNPPTRAVPITQLPKGLLISIEAIAVRP